MLARKVKSAMNNQRKSRHAVYLLPNAFTTAALFAGFFAILQAVRGDWQQAATAVLIAAMLDTCDGRVARWTNSQSAFGAEYDSLSDAIAFGVAPALMAYQWGLQHLGKLGLGVAFCYCAAAVMRLARFNTQAGSVDRRFFIGIPTPAAAILIVSLLATLDKSGVNPQTAGLWTAAAVAATALTMVSGVRYYSFKDFNIKKRIPFRYIAVFFLTAALLYSITDTLMEVLLAALSIYLFSGYGYAIWTRLRRRSEPPPPNTTDTNH